MYNAAPIRPVCAMHIMLLLLFFSFGLVQTNLTNQSQKREKRYDFQSQGYQDALKDLAQWAQEVGPYRVCSAQRYSQLAPTMQQCTQEKQTELQNGLSSTNFCPLIDPYLQCMDPLNECYTTQELNRFKTRIMYK